MPTPASWYRRAGDILLDERNKRYLGMTEPTDPSGLRATADAIRDTIYAALAATPPASGPLDVGRLLLAYRKEQRFAGPSWGDLSDNEQIRLIADRYARLTANAEGRE